MAWVKGQSGNPSGRPRKHNSLSEALQHVVDKRELALVIWKAAQQGEQWACSLIFQRLEPQQNTLKLKHEVRNDERARRFDYSRLTTEELQQLERLFLRASSDGVAADPGRAMPAEPALLPPAGVADN